MRRECGATCGANLHAAFYQETLLPPLPYSPCTLSHCEHAGLLPLSCPTTRSDFPPPFSVHSSRLSTQIHQHCLPAFQSPMLACPPPSLTLRLDFRPRMAYTARTNATTVTLHAVSFKFISVAPLRPISSPPTSVYTYYHWPFSVLPHSPLTLVHSDSSGS